MKKLILIIGLLIPASLFSLPQLTIDLAVYTWCKDYYQRLTTFEKKVIKKYISSRSDLIEKAEMVLVTPIRKELLDSNIKNFFKKYSIYYQLLRLPTILDILLISFDTEWNFKFSYSLQQAQNALIKHELYVKKPTAFGLNKLFDETEDYYIERWYFLSECLACKL